MSRNTPSGVFRQDGNLSADDDKPIKTLSKQGGKKNDKRRETLEHDNGKSGICC